MILVIAPWTFLRTWLLGSTAIALENLALRHQLLVLQRSGADHVCLGGTGSFGSGCHASGWGGGPAWPSYSPPRCWPGTAKVSSSTGGGSRRRTQSAARDSTPRFAV